MIKKVVGWFERHYFISFFIALIVAGFIFYMSSLSFEKETSRGFPYKSYVYHFGIFFILAFFLSVSLVKGKRSRKYFLLVALIAAILYGISDEFHQLFISNRFYDIKDILINSIGILALGIMYAFRIKRNK